MAHWLSMRQGISEWKARRWVAAAHALEGLPQTSEAFASGEVGIDKVVELTRLATPQTEGDLLPWAKRVSCACIRRKADLAARQAIEDIQDAERSLCSARIGEDADPDRATVVIHTRLEGLLDGSGGCEIEGGPMSAPSRGAQPADSPQAHHIVWWEHGGSTDLENLVVVCTFHHRLVHAYRWSVRRQDDGTIRWFRPDGNPYRSGPAPPLETLERQPVVSAVGA